YLVSLVRHFCFVPFNHTATIEIYTLSLHDALPISRWARWMSTSDLDLVHTAFPGGSCQATATTRRCVPTLLMISHRQHRKERGRSEEHTSELQSRFDLVCRLLLETKTDNA